MKFMITRLSIDFRGWTGFINSPTSSATLLDGTGSV